MIDNQAKQLELRAVMKEISQEMETIENARDQIKEIITAASDTFKIPKPLLRKVAKVYHNRDLSKHQTALAEVKDLYADITEGMTKEQVTEL
jgi:hypothetical protein